MQLGLAIYCMCIAGIVGGIIGAGCVSFSHFNEKERERKKALEKEREPSWEPRKETRNGFVYKDEKTGRESDRHSCVVVFCQRGYSKVDIGWEDVRKDDLTTKVAAMMEKAEEKCSDLNALEVE